MGGLSLLGGRGSGLVAIRRVQRLSTFTSVRPISPASPVCDTAPRCHWPAVAPVQLRSTRPIVPMTASVGALSIFRLPPGVAEMAQVYRS